MVCEHLCKTLSWLDIIINNACQTIPEAPAYYRHLMPIEQMPKKDMPQDGSQYLAWKIRRPMR